MASEKPRIPVAAAFFFVKRQGSQNGAAKVVERGDKILDVHFNPAALKYSVRNDSNAGRGKNTTQHIRHSSATISMELTFDTTGTGEDVRRLTAKLAALVEALPDGKALPTVVFEWGTYTFTGIVKSYEETTDFFSADGVPLRANVNLSMEQGAAVLSRDANQQRPSSGSGEPQALNTPAGQSTTDTGARGGEPRLGRAIASFNQLENMRLPPSGQLFLPRELDRPGVANFVSSGDRSAASGAFAGLRASVGQSGLSPLDLNALRPPTGSPAVFTGDDASFAVDGRAQLDEGASLRADVGARVSLSDRLRFDEG